MAGAPSNSQSRHSKLSDIVFAHREPSPIRPAIDDILYALGDPQIVVTASLLLDLIELRWLAYDVLRGQGYTLSAIAKMDDEPAMTVRAIPCETK